MLTYLVQNLMGYSRSISPRLTPPSPPLPPSQNLMGYSTWDASVCKGTPQGVTMFVVVALGPALVYALCCRGVYMLHYRYVDESIEAYHEAATNPLLCSPQRIQMLITAFFSRSARTSDTGKVYLIRIYMTLLITAAMLIIVRRRGAPTLLFSRGTHPPPNPPLLACTVPSTRH
jgi:hypothetical protein